MASRHKAMIAGMAAVAAQAATLLAAAFMLPGWQLGVFVIAVCTGAALYWYGHHVGYGEALASSWDDEARAIYEWYASGQ